MATIERAIRHLGNLQLAIAAALFAGCGILYCYEIGLRLFAHSGIPDYFEIIGISFLYVFLLGAGALYTRDEDVNIDFIYARMPESMRRWWLLAVNLLILGIVGVTAVATWQVIVLQANVPTPLLRIPESVRWLPLLIAAVSIALTAAARAYACVIWIRTGVEPGLLRMASIPGEEKEEVL